VDATRHDAPAALPRWLDEPPLPPPPPPPHASHTHHHHHHRSVDGTAAAARGQQATLVPLFAPGVSST
jgi:hypothetical protein